MLVDIHSSIITHSGENGGICWTIPVPMYQKKVVFPKKCEYFYDL